MAVVSVPLRLVACTLVLEVSDLLPSCGCACMAVLFCLSGLQNGSFDAPFPVSTGTSCRRITSPVTDMPAPCFRELTSCAKNVCFQRKAGVLRRTQGWPGTRICSENKISGNERCKLSYVSE